MAAADVRLWEEVQVRDILLRPLAAAAAAWPQLETVVFFSNLGQCIYNKITNCILTRSLKLHAGENFYI